MTIKEDNMFNVDSSNTLSYNLLASIPMKIQGWLTEMGIEPEGVVTVYDLGMHFHNSDFGNSGLIALDDIELRWHFDESSFLPIITVNKQWLTDCNKNLSQFIEFEQNVYDRLQALQDTL